MPLNRIAVNVFACALLAPAVVINTLAAETNQKGGTVLAADLSGARLTSVPIQQVTIEDAFWSPKIKTWREVTISDCLSKFEKDGTLLNFDRVRDGLVKAGESYNAALGSFESRVLPSANRLKELAAPDHDEALESPEPVEVVLRTIPTLGDPGTEKTTETDSAPMNQSEDS